MACSNRLTSNINDGCNSDSVKGFEQKAFIYNWDDIDHSFKNLDYLASFLIQSNTGYPIYLYGEKPFEGTKRELEKGKYNNTFMEVASFALLADNPANAAAVQAMSRGRWVLMFEKTSGAGWTIYGLENGLKAETKVSDIYGEAAWEVTLASKGNYFSSMFLSPTYPAPWEQIVPEVLLTNYVMLPITLSTGGQFFASNKNGSTPTGLECIFYDAGVYHGHDVVANDIGAGSGKRLYLDKTITHLTLNQNTASNISGGVDLSLFESLTDVNMNGNSVTSLVLPANALALNAATNNLTSINLQDCPNISFISISLNGNLSSINLSNGSKIAYLGVYSCGFASLDLTKCVSIITLEAYNNPLTSVDLTKCVALTSAVLSNCRLTTLDASKNVNLTSLSLNNSGSYPSNSNAFAPTALKNTIVGLVQGKAAAGKTQMTAVYVAGNPNVANLWAEDWSAITNSTDIVDNTSLAAELLNFNITLVTTT